MRGVGFAAALVGVAAIAAVSVMATGGGAAAHQSRMHPQDVASELVLQLGDRPGFSGVTIENGTVTLRWRRSVPNDVAMLVRDRATASRVPIVTATSGYSQEELATEGARLVLAFQAGWPRVLAAGPNADSSAIRLQVAPGTLAEVGDKPLASLLGTSYPLDIVEGDAPIAG